MRSKQPEWMFRLARQHVPGTGMGLVIAREILIAHGGDIKVESSPENGTEFSLRFLNNPGGEGA